MERKTRYTVTSCLGCLIKKYRPLRATTLSGFLLPEILAILAKKEKEKTRLVAYRAANSEKVKAAAAKYRNANREKLRMRAAKYYADNHEKVMEQHAAYRAAKKAKAATTGDNHE